MMILTTSNCELEFIKLSFINDPAGIRVTTPVIRMMWQHCLSRVLTANIHHHTVLKSTHAVKVLPPICGQTHDARDQTHDAAWSIARCTVIKHTMHRDQAHDAPWSSARCTVVYGRGALVPGFESVAALEYLVLAQCVAAVYKDMFYNVRHHLREMLAQLYIRSSSDRS